MSKKPFKKGMLVRIVDDDNVYGAYSQIIKRHPKFAIRWCYKDWSPDTNPLYVVRGVYRHCMRDSHDKCKWCVVIEQVKTQKIYLIGELGLQKAFKWSED